MNQTLITHNTAPTFIRPSGVLFDLDGTLINTVPKVLESFRLACLEVTGIDLSEEAMVPLLGMNDADTQKHFAREYDDDGFPYSAIRERQKSIQVELFSTGIPFMPGALDCLEEVRRLGIPFGVHTGSTLAEAKFKLAKSGLEQEVRLYVAGDDVSKGKPAPDILLKLLDLMREAPRGKVVPSRECLVIGDSRNDITAGKSAGMRTAYVPDRYSCKDALSLSDHTFTNLREFASHLR